MKTWTIRTFLATRTAQSLNYKTSPVSSFVFATVMKNCSNIRKLAYPTIHPIRLRIVDHHFCYARLQPLVPYRKKFGTNDTTLWTWSAETVIDEAFTKRCDMRHHGSNTMEHTTQRRGHKWLPKLLRQRRGRFIACFAQHNTRAVDDKDFIVINTGITRKKQSLE